MSRTLSREGGLSLLSSPFFFPCKFIYKLLAVLVFDASAAFSPGVGSGDHSPVAVHRPLIEAASLVTEHGLWGTQGPVISVRGLCRCGSAALECRLSSCGTLA